MPDYDEEVFKQLEEVRRDGATNMLDKNGVLQVANRLDLHTLVATVADMSTGEYGNLVMKEFGEWRKKNQ